ncbi:MAG: immune inhibitor A [Muribaculaceae bacterium]|nr:immune inhibitor A [Muribaculaceae bacterium]
MKKLLLSLAGALAMAFTASAAEVTISSFAKEGDNVTASKDGFSVLVEKNNGSTAPAIYDGVVRVYAKGTITVSGEKIEKVVINLASTGAKRYTTVTASTGTVATQAEGDETVTWTGDATSVTFTVGDKATLGSDGEAKAGQIHFDAINITGDGGSGTVTPQPTAGLTASFQDGTLGGFTVENKIESEWEGWYAKTNYPPCAIANSYISGTNYAAESWLVSPVVDLTAATTASMSVKMGFGFDFPTAQNDNYTVLVKAEGGDWSTLAITNFPAAPEPGKNWTDFVENSWDLAAYAGKKVQVAFRYITDGSKSRAWELQDFALTCDGGTVTPPEPQGTKYQKATALTTGSYVFVVNEEGTYKLGTPAAAGLTYGRISLVDATVANDAVETAEANAFDITVADGKATIKDAEGRYYAMDDNHLTSFQFYTELNDGCYWTFTFSGDQIKLTNALNTDCFVCQSKGNNGTWYTNVAPAASPAEFNLPMVFKKAVVDGIAEIAADENAPVEYFNLQGVRVANPENGLYIRRQGNKTTKVLVK